MSEAELDQSRIWTEAEYLALGRTSSKVELIDGRLQVNPGPTWAHQEISSQVTTTMRPAALGAKLRIAEGVNVRLSPGRILIPDIVVADISRHERAEVTDASKVVLVAEITSPSNAAVDRTRKMRLYAAAQIAWYLLIEPDMRDYESVHLRLFHLHNADYVLHASAEHGETLTADGPFLIEIRTTDLVQP